MLVKQNLDLLKQNLQGWNITPMDYSNMQTYWELTLTSTINKLSLEDIN